MNIAAAAHTVYSSGDGSTFVPASSDPESHQLTRWAGRGEAGLATGDSDGGVQSIAPCLQTEDLSRHHGIMGRRF